MEDVRSLDPAVLDDVTPVALLGLTNDGLLTLNHVGGPEGTQLVPDLAVAVPSPAEDGRTSHVSSATRDPVLHHQFGFPTRRAAFV